MNISDAIQLTFELWGLLFLLLGIVLVAVSYKIDIKRAKNLVSMMVLCLVMNLSNTVTIFPGLDKMIVSVCYFIMFASMYHLIACFADYTKYLIGGNKALIIVNILSILETLVLIVSMFTGWIFTIDDNGRYQPGQYYWITRAMVIVSFVVELIIVLKERKKGEARTIWAIVIAYTFLLLVLVFQIKFADAALLPIAFTICTMLAFVMYEMNMAFRLRDDEKKLNDERVSMIKAQVKPHFIFNTLTTIRSLARKDGDEAVEAIDEFSGYLRASIDVLNEQNPISIMDEIRTTEQYLSLQKRRFGDKLNYEFILRDRDFLIPAFAVQTIVENSVGHGIRNKPEGGKVTITTYFDGVYHIVEIEDNGVGFDPSKKTDDGRSHVGLQNTKDRILIMCGGKMAVQSKVGEGTLVRLEIPSGGVNKT